MIIFVLFIGTACVLYLLFVVFHICETVLYRLSRRMWRKNHPYEEIDPKIKSLVEAMNATGAIKTIASCQGHFDRRNPYISFKSSLTIASYLEKLFREDAMHDKGTFSLSWKVEPCFDQNYELSHVIRLESCDVDDIIDRFITLIIRRKALDADLAAMEKMIKDASSEAVFTDASVDN